MYGWREKEREKETYEGRRKKEKGISPHFASTMVGLISFFSFLLILEFRSTATGTLDKWSP